MTSWTFPSPTIFQPSWLTAWDEDEDEVDLLVIPPLDVPLPAAPAALPTAVPVLPAAVPVLPVTVPVLPVALRPPIASRGCHCSRMCREHLPRLGDKRTCPPLPP